MTNKNKNRIKRKIKKHDSLTPFIYTYKFYKNKFNEWSLKREFNVSVIMTGKADSKSIKSILSQSFNNFELIVINKTDNKPIKSNKIKYYPLDYSNTAEARNYGIKKANGNVIAYLDSGNIWKEEFLKSMLKKLKKSDCAYCESVEFNRKKLLKNNIINLNSFIHKKDMAKKYGNFDEELNNLEDWDLIIRYTKDEKPAFLKKSLVKINNKKDINNEDTYIIRERYWHELYQDEYELIKDHFDEEYYLNEYGDELPNELSPIHHYLIQGYKENKNPNPEFISSFYRNKYKVKTNPLVHYLKNDSKNQINYFEDKEKIIKTNSLYLSNYEFEEEPLVSIIILNKDGLHHLKRLFKHFELKTNYSNYEIIVVDNASEDESVEYLKSLDLNITVIEKKENVSFAKGNNDAAKIAKGEYLLLLNNDIEPTYGWLNEMVGTILYNKNVASVGAKLIYPYIEDEKNTKKSFTIQHAGDILRQAIDEVCLYKGHNQNKFSKEIFDSEISVNKKRLLCTAAVLLVKKSVYEELNGLDEKYWYGYEDIDYNLKVNKAGYSTVFASAALLFHHESATRKTISRENHKVFCQKWSKYLFKKLLQDKIEKNEFFTDEKLNVMLVGDSNFGDYEEAAHNLAIFCSNNNYNISTNFDLNNLKIGHHTDILVSFTRDYDIEHLHSRANLIKILVSNENLNVNETEYDIILEDNEYIGKNLISKLYETFLNN